MIQVVSFVLSLIMVVLVNYLWGIGVVLAWGFIGMSLGLESELSTEISLVLGVMMVMPVLTVFAIRYFFVHHNPYSACGAIVGLLIIAMFAIMVLNAHH